MNRETGQALAGIDHLRQSVADIITTPIGSRVMRRTYGSLVPALLDQPLNKTTQMRVAAAATSALMRWEPRLLVRKIRLEHLRPDEYGHGHGRLYLEATIRAAGARGRPIEMEVAV